MAQQLWRFYSVVFLVFLMVACSGQQNTISTPTTLPQPTLTPLPTDWGQIEQPTVALEQAEELELAVEEVATATPTAQPTETSVPPTAVPPTATPSATATEPPPTPTAVPTIFAPTPEPTELPEDVEQSAAAALLSTRAEFDGNLSKPILREKIKQVQLRVREVVFMLTQSAGGADFPCQKLVPAYRFMRDETPTYNVDEALRLSNLHYNRAVNRAIISLNPLYVRCQGLETTGGNFELIANDDLKPSDFGVAAEQSGQVSADINDALLWINGDDSKSRSLYENLRATIYQLGDHYAKGDTSRCDEIFEIYQSVEALPRLVVPEGPRLEAYLNYLDAINFLIQGSETLNLHCKEQLERNNGTPESDEAGLPLPPELLKVAELTRKRALTAAEAAVAALPKPTPVATLAAVGGRVLSVGPGPTANTFEVRVRASFGAGLNPTSVRIGEFVMDANGVITITHTCGKDFFDAVVLIAADGTRYESPKISAARPASCGG